MSETPAYMGYTEAHSESSAADLPRLELPTQPFTARTHAFDAGGSGGSLELMGGTVESIVASLSNSVSHSDADAAPVAVPDFGVPTETESGDRRRSERGTPDRRHVPRSYASPWMADPHGAMDPRPLSPPHDGPAPMIAPIDARLPELPVPAPTASPVAAAAPAPAIEIAPDPATAYTAAPVIIEAAPVVANEAPAVVEEPPTFHTAIPEVVDASLTVAQPAPAYEPLHGVFDGVDLSIAAAVNAPLAPAAPVEAAPVAAPQPTGIPVDVQMSMNTPATWMTAGPTLAPPVGQVPVAHPAQPAPAMQPAPQFAFGSSAHPEMLDPNFAPPTVASSALARVDALLDAAPAPLNSPAAVAADAVGMPSAPTSTPKRSRGRLFEWAKLLAFAVIGGVAVGLAVHFYLQYAH